ncbi:YceD family protein [Flavobacterium sp. SM2513]|uniref:YceD family protein n=1 Tax=Flavobacterium sp. SM2513 TaxID=3424766 RepID=UPI003D7F29F8
MKKLNEYLIPFVGLKLGKHQFEYQINRTFFDYFEFDEFENANIKVELVLEKKSLMLELNFKHKGTVYVPCDVTGEMFDLPIKGELRVVVQFGDEFNNENDELLILPHGEHQIDISQYIYEMIALSVPLKRVHPGVEDGTLQSAALDKLNELKVTEVKEEVEEEKEIDPRWDKLKQLLTDK